MDGRIFAILNMSETRGFCFDSNVAERLSGQDTEEVGVGCLSSGRVRYDLGPSEGFIYLNDESSTFVAKSANFEPAGD